MHDCLSLQQQMDNGRYLLPGVRSKIATVCLTKSATIHQQVQGSTPYEAHAIDR